MIIKADQLMFRQEEIHLQTQTKHLVKQLQLTMELEKEDLLMEVLLQIDREIARQVLVLQIQIQHRQDLLLLVSQCLADSQLQHTADRRLRRLLLADPLLQDLLVAEAPHLADHVHKFNFI